VKKWQYFVILLLVVTIIGGLLTDRWLRPYNLASEQAAARRAGIPLSPTDLDRPHPPPGQDAAPDWIAFTSLLHARPLDMSALRPAASVRPGRRPATAAERNAAWAQLVKSRPEVMERVHIAASKSGAYFPLTWKPDDLFSYFGPMRQAAQLVAAESLQMARAGRYDEAVRNQALGFRIADHAAMHPTAIGYLVAAAIDGITTSGMEDLLHLAGRNRQMVAEIRDVLEKSPTPLDVDLAMHGDVLYGVTAIRSIQSLADVNTFGGGTSPGAPGPSLTAMPNGLVIAYVAKPAEAAYLHEMTPVFEALKLPRMERTAAFNRLETGRSARLSNAPGPRLAAQMLLGFSKLEMRGTLVEARRRVLLAGAAVLLYRAQEGHYPPRLENAMPNPPTDAISGKPLGYRREADGFVVYSSPDPTDSKPKPIRFEYPGILP
jgi:hypothetical protein